MELPSNAYCMSERWCEALETYPDGYEQPIAIGVDPDYGIVCEGACFHLCCLLKDREDEIISEDIPF